MFTKLYNWKGYNIMKIGFFIGGLGTGGAQRVICNLSNYLSQKHSVTIITMSSITSSYKLNENVEHISLEKQSEKSNFIIRNIKRIIRLNQIIKQQDYDIIITFLPITSFIMLLFRKRIKIPIIVSVRNDPKIEYSSKISNLLMRLLYPLADGFIFQTEEAKKYFDSIDNITKKNSIILPNPINEDFIEEPFGGERKKVIVSVGRLAEQKNHMLLINAFNKVADKYSDYKLIIYGEGHLRHKLEEKIRELNLEERVKLAGSVKNIKHYIRDASLFILSSDYEGMPNALMEAMALGLPVISTDCPCGGPRFLIKNGINGLLVPTNDCDSMAEAIDKILGDKNFSAALGKQAVRIVEELDPIKIYKQWENYIIESVDKLSKKTFI